MAILIETRRTRKIARNVSVSWFLLHPPPQAEKFVGSKYFHKPNTFDLMLICVSMSGLTGMIEKCLHVLRAPKGLNWKSTVQDGELQSAESTLARAWATPC